MKEYEATGKFVDISKYEKKMDSDFGFWQKRGYTIPLSTEFLGNAKTG
jgi:hypothetical protein